MKIVVGICTFKRYELLRQLLFMLTGQRLSESLSDVEVEVLIVDNEPSAATYALFSDIQSSYFVPLSYIEESERGISQARNRAIKYALGTGADYLVFIDDDDIPGPDWLELLWQERLISCADIVFGTWELSEDLPQWVHKSGIFKSKTHSKRKAVLDSELSRMASTCNVLISCNLFATMLENRMLFDPALGRSGGEDKDFFIRAQAVGATFSYAEKSYVVRGHQPDRYQRLGLIKRGFKNGSSRMGRMRRHREDKSSAAQLLSSAVKLLAVLVALPFSLFSQALLMHQLYRLGKATGVIYGYFSKNDFAYYGQEAEGAEE